jgi:hypothetical protein
MWPKNLTLKKNLFNQSWSLLICCCTFRPLWFAKYILKTFTEYTQRTTVGGVSYTFSKR